MNETLGLGHYLGHADAIARVVLGLLLASSIASWYLILNKSLRILINHRLSQRFLKVFWDAPNLEAITHEIRHTGTPEPFSSLLHHGFTAIDYLSRKPESTGLVNVGSPHESLARALRRGIEEVKMQLEFGQTFLATVASSAPFIGLLGTVWGIYHALMAIGLSGQDTLDKVAGPVGEALIMTGIGLAVAIPATIAYNSFARSNRNTLSKLSSFAYDVHNLLASGIKASPLREDAGATSDKVRALLRAATPNHLPSKEGEL